MATIDVWIAAGQSNMCGLGDKNKTPPLDPALCWEFNYESNSIVTLADPGPNNVHHASTGCCLPEMAKTFTTRSGRPSLFVRTARGGSALLAKHASSNGDWSSTGTWFPNMVTRVQAAITKATGAGHTIGRVNVLWHQGEQDCKEVDDGTYEAAYADLINRFRTALSQPSLQIFCARIGSPSSAAVAIGQAPYWESIRAAQVRVCDATAGMHMAYLDCMYFFERHWMNADGMHYNQNGLNEMGRAFGNTAADYFGYPAAPEEPPPGEVRSPSSQAAALLRVADQVIGIFEWSTVGSFDFVVPSGVTTLPSVDVRGAGGGGGFSPVLNNRAGGGGGGGGRSQSTNVPVTEGETLTIKVGAGGTAGTSGVQPGAGQECGVFRGATPLVRVAGATGGTNAAVATTSPAGAGGVPSHGDVQTTGDAGTGGTSANGTGAGGNAASGGGTGGVGVTGTQPGNPGTAPGGGGSGGRNGQAGAAGARGKVRIAFPTT